MKKSFWRQVALVISLIAVISMTVYAQPGGGRGGRQGGGGGRQGGGFGGGGFGAILAGGGDARFALRSDVSKELDLSQDQTAELRSLAEDAPSARDLMREMDIDMRALFQLSPEEREKELAPLTAKLAKANAEAREEVLDALTSKQKTRFAELKFQWDVSQGQSVAALEAEDVKLDADKKTELQEAMREVDSKLQERIAQLRLQLYVEALGKVVSDDKIEKMMGEAFVFESGAGRGGFGAGGQRGGRGGFGAGGGQRGGRAGGGGGRGGGDAGDNPRRRQRPDDGGGDDEAEEENPRRRRN